ncbi:hypothetical protein WME87_11305 [Sorangium sp. So ce1389]
MKTLLDRLDALEKSPARKATRKDDHAALETLAKRVITREERTRLRQLVDTASGAGAAAEEDDEEAIGDAATVRAVVDSREHVEALRALHAWHREWGETVRAVVKRRDFLVRLGLAHRKVKALPGKRSDRRREAQVGTVPCQLTGVAPRLDHLAGFDHREIKRLEGVGAARGSMDRLLERLLDLDVDDPFVVPVDRAVWLAEEHVHLAGHAPILRCECQMP